MTNYAATPREARNAFVSMYPFDLANGGRGNSLTLGTGTGSTWFALVGVGPQVMITNTGTVNGHLVFGVPGDPAADVTCVVILPGLPYTLSIPPEYTHVAGYSASATTINIVRGYGD